MSGAILLSTARVHCLWVTAAFGGSGMLYACSIPSEAKEPSRGIVIEGLARRRLAFIELDPGDRRAEVMAEAVYMAGLESGCEPRLSFDGMTPFQRRVIEQVRSIPRGSVSTYGDIAAAAGHPRAARAAGTVMAKNPFPWVVPCHRVVKSDMRPGMFGQERLGDRGTAAKARLLSSEGVEISGGRIAIRARHRPARGM